MSASPRPITASPRSSVYDCVASPDSPSSDSRGPAAMRLAPNTAVPGFAPDAICTDTRLPTSVPQRGQVVFAAAADPAPAPEPGANGAAGRAVATGEPLELTALAGCGCPPD